MNSNENENSPLGFSALAPLSAGLFAAFLVVSVMALIENAGHQITTGIGLAGVGVGFIIFFPILMITNRVFVRWGLYI